MSKQALLRDLTEFSGYLRGQQTDIKNMLRQVEEMRRELESEGEEPSDVRMVCSMFGQCEPKELCNKFPTLFPKALK